MEKLQNPLHAGAPTLLGPMPRRLVTVKTV